MLFSSRYENKFKCFYALFQTLIKIYHIKNKLLPTIFSVLYDFYNVFSSLAIIIYNIIWWKEYFFYDFEIFIEPIVKILECLKFTQECCVCVWMHACVYVCMYLWTYYAMPNRKYVIHYTTLYDLQIVPLGYWFYDSVSRPICTFRVRLNIILLRKLSLYYCDGSAVVQ